MFQLILASLLTASDFGIYAIAISIAGIAQTFRGGGSTQWLIQGGEREHAARSGDAFWTAMVANLALGAALIAIAHPMGALLSQPQVPELIIWIGATIPLLTTGSYFQTRLQIQLRIRELTIIELGSALLRGGLTVLLATLGFGPLAFVLPNLPCYLFEHVLGYYFVRESPWRQRPAPSRWLGVFRTTKWAILATFGLVVGLQADNVIIAAFATSATVGYYYFAFQLTFQSAGVVTSNINRILTSAFVAKSKAIDAALFSRATRTIMTVGSPLVLGLATAIAPLEHMLWHGKWDASIDVVITLSLALPLFLLTTIVTAGMVSSGKFKPWAALNLFKAIGVVALAGAAGAFFPDNVHAMSIVIAAGLTVVHAVQCVWAIRSLRLSTRTLFKDSGFGLIAAPALALASNQTLRALEASDPVALFAGPSLFFGAYAFAWAALHPTATRALLQRRHNTRRSAIE